VALAACLVIALVVLAVGQSPQADPAQEEMVETITLPVRQSRIYQSPWPVTRVSVADPDIADVKVLSPRQIMLLGKEIGATDFVLWGDSEQMSKHRIHVSIDFGYLESQLNAMLPGARLKVGQTHNVLTVSGLLRKAEHADQLRRFLEAAEIKFVDLTSLAGVHQVLLRVRVAEVSRRAVRALGVNTFITGSDLFGGITIGSERGGALNPISIAPPQGALARHGVPFIFNAPTTVTPAVTVFGGIPKIDLEMFIQALNENQYMRVLAEPSLVAASGSEASFLAGGEYPIPVVQGAGTSVSTSITIEYREFGVRLKFRPTVLGDGTIRLQVSPEVSQLSDIGAVEVEGFRIPSLLTRRAQTELELKSGQTFAMAGLLNRFVTARNSRVPGVGDVPILGILFRSTRYESEETELLVLVTATLVEPLDHADRRPTPGSLDTDPSDWEFYLEGRVQGRRPPRLSPAQAARFRDMGLGRLVGPGAWATYDVAPPPSRAPLEPFIDSDASDEMTTDVQPNEDPPETSRE